MPSNETPAGGEPDESPQERLDRELAELVQELRAVIPGVEVLFAFLLTVAFTERFERLTGYQEGVYLVTFLAASLALVLLLTPTSIHRLRFRQRDKEHLVKVSNRYVIVAMVLVAVSIVGAILLVVDVMASTGAAVIAAAAVGAVLAANWWVLPLRRAVRDRG